MKFSGMICHHPRTNRLDFGRDQAKGQGQGHGKVKNYQTKLHEIFRQDFLSFKDQSIRFWEQSGQRSWKGRKRILVVITRSVFIRFIWNQRQHVHFQFPILWQMWRWQRYALYRVPVLVITVITITIIVVIIPISFIIIIIIIISVMIIAIIIIIIFIIKIFHWCCTGYLLLLVFTVVSVWNHNYCVFIFY